MNLPTLDTHQAVRAAAPGCFIALCFLIFVRVGVLPSIGDLLLSLQGMVGFLVVGFLFDILGAYKIHPWYRVIRKNFFLRISELQPEPDDVEDADKIATGEHLREAIIYSQDANRVTNLRFEHAVWITLYNIHILSFLLVLVIFIFQWQTRGIREISSDMALWYALVALLIIGCVTLFAAVGRNKSYNQKVINSGKKIRKAELRIE
ncbi:hypothetical protein QE369_000758 [Agrobacterium larrymoorei]|uniref:Uncharacterized protein n=1 Tax=Agrobacterium larrymoorei TaxID=160699 RepID=A0AAJ2BJ32_9HYPH|nr:hypothetical protein [Agrobacterium larrymoorei]MDR6100580.1 hypothetical protein [Agrobacterium larrymoorei]